MSLFSNDYKKIVDNITSPVIILNLKGEIVYFNNSLCELTGYTVEELQNKIFWNLIDNESKDRLSNLSIDFNTKIKDCVKIITKNDDIKELEINIKIVELLGLKYILINANDITELKRKERELDKSLKDIEILVHERTMEIQKMNIALQADIMLREKAEKKIKESIENLKRIINSTVDSISIITEKRDPYTAGHQRRVAKLAVAIAKKLGLKDDDCNTIYIAAVLHDIGKIQIPAEILSKPGKLLEAEMDLLKLHPEVGYDILKNVPFDKPVAEIVRQHHEKLNGSGYPHGLTKNDILFEARIITVADVVEAISSHRPYREALGLDFALKIINELKDEEFDREVVEACNALIKEDKFDFIKS